jgi:hypothetical protein
MISSWLGLAPFWFHLCSFWFPFGFICVFGGSWRSAEGRPDLTEPNTRFVLAGDRRPHHNIEIFQIHPLGTVRRAAEGLRCRRWLLRSFYFPMRPAGGRPKAASMGLHYFKLHCVSVLKISHLNPLRPIVINFVFDVCVSCCYSMARLWLNGFGSLVWDHSRARARALPWPLLA